MRTGAIRSRLVAALVAALAARALAGAQPAEPSPLEAAIEAHCGSRPVEREPDAYGWLAEWSLEGAGAHRELRVIASRPADGGRAAPVLLVPVPAEVYADPYELDRIARRAGTPSPTLFGYMDLEAVASAAREAALAVPWRTEPGAGGEESEESEGGAAGGASGGRASSRSFAVPLHSRSPRPLDASEVALRGRFRTLALPPPRLLLVEPSRCRLLGGAPPPAPAVPVWRVPAASAAHARAVDAGVAASVLLMGGGYAWVLLRGRRGAAEERQEEEREKEE